MGFNDGLKSLAELPVRSFAYVVTVGGQGLTRRRLLDLGFVPGTLIEVIRSGPCGDPVAYGVRGTTVALRREAAGEIQVKAAGKGWPGWA
ncbi:MAG: ferrous iron transport protein [Clostridia bacterium]|nr:ferrous iron transport protein [Clostridia bacterium]